MSGRIWPGALCVWVGGGVNGGRIVVAERPSVDGELFMSICGKRTRNRRITSRVAWVVSCATPLSWTDDFGIQRYYMKRSASESLLRPILPPPDADTTEDRSPCELESM